MNVAIIPSSTKSVRLPGKNILPVNGKPMIAYPIKAAMESGMFDEVIVSTADPETIRIVEDLGCKVYPSPPALQSKTSTTEKVCNNVLGVMEHWKKLPEYFCCIYATAIFLEPKDFRKSFDLLDGTDFVMGVSEFVQEPAHALIEHNGYLRPVDSKAFAHKAPRFQPQYSSNGTLYWCMSKPFMATKTFYGSRLTAYETPRSRAVDINTPDDLILAKNLASAIFA